MKRITSMAILLMIVIIASAQIQSPVKFSSQLKTNKSAEAEIVFTAKIAAGWHVYSTRLGAEGPTSASFTASKLDGVELVGKLQAHGKEISAYDKNFEATLRYFEHSVTFTQKVRFTKPNYVLKGYLEYGACSDQTCMAPTSVDIDKSGKSPAVAAGKDAKAEAGKEVPSGELLAAMTTAAAQGNQDAQEGLAKLQADNMDKAQQDSAALASAAATSSLTKAEKDALWKPVIKEIHEQNGGDGVENQSWGYIFLMGFLGGLLALFTPCVWPIIPMTVSFFLKRAKDDRRKGIRDAITYGISIIVIYLFLGLAVTRIFGASALNAWSTKPFFNIIFFLMLVVFALSFFGWFEIKLPEKWGNAVDTKASSTTGLLSIFLMAFTLTLVSFSCTGPIIGFLLVASTTSGSLLGPAFGMLGFAVALALPFTLFAMFPSWLKSAPKSGSWMNTIKIVLGFIELAFSLKFFSTADMTSHWNLLSREAFLAIWIVIFAALGLYLIGKLKFQSDTVGGDVRKPMPVPCIMLGLCSLAFSVYMVPGLWGAPVKAVSAFAPPIETQDFNLNTKVVKAHYTDYETGMAAAKAMNKPVLIDFTGYGCTNCRKMESAVWTDPRVMEMLEKDYVLISLYVDDNKRLPQEIEIMENGQKRTLRTVADKWSYLQRSKFGANTQPFYVPVDNDGNPLVGSYSYNEDIPAYIKFLQKGLKAYQKKK